MRSRVKPTHIQEEILNIRQVEAAQFYRRVSCPVLILRATDGILGQDDLVLPEASVERMLREIPNARRVDIKRTNHFSILFQPNGIRDGACCAFPGSLDLRAGRQGPRNRVFPSSKYIVHPISSWSNNFVALQPRCFTTGPELETAWNSAVVTVFKGRDPKMG